METFDKTQVANAAENKTLKLKIAELEQEVALLKAANATQPNLSLAQADLLEPLQYQTVLLDTLFDNAPLGIGLWDKELRFVRLNNTLAEINGLPTQAHIGKTVAELLPEVEPKVMATFRQVVETGEAVTNQEVSGITPAQPSQIRYWLVSYYPLRFDNQIIGVGAICEEITAKKQAEAERAELLKREQAAYAEAEIERQRLVSLFNQAPALIAIQEGSEHTFKFINPIAQQAIGGRDVTGLTLCQALPEVEAQGFNAIFDEIYRTGTPYLGNETNVKLNLPDGTVREGIYNLLYQPWRDANGQVIGIMTFAVDVTEHVAARRQAEASEARFRFLAEISKLLATTLDYHSTLQNIVELSVPYLADWCSIDLISEDGTIIRVATAHVNQAKRDLAHRLLELYPNPPDQPSPLTQGMWAKKSFLFEEINEKQLTQIARSQQHLQTLKVLGIKSGINVPLVARDRVLGAITLALSESDRRYNQDDLELAEEVARRAAQAIDNAQLYQEAQIAIEDRNEFLSVAAHELKTPLTGLQGYVQLLARQLDKTGTLDPVRMERALVVINQQSNKLKSLLNQLLDVSRIEAGRLSVEPVLTNLVELVSGVIVTVQATTTIHSINLKAPVELMAEIDPLRFEQVVVNLVDNAVKYSPEGGLVEVELAVSDANMIYLAVNDTGVGIAPEQRVHIFDRFYQVNKGYQLKGMGLGLYISRQIVELHQGHIEVEEQPGGGTRFIVRFPQRAAS